MDCKKLNYTSRGKPIAPWVDVKDATSLDANISTAKTQLKQFLKEEEGRIIEELLAVKDSRKLKYCISMLKTVFGSEIVDQEPMMTPLLSD